MIILAAWDVNSGLTVQVITMNVLALQPCLPDSGGSQSFGYDTISFFTRSHHAKYGERIRLLTAALPACVHASQNRCLARRPGDVLARNVRTLAPKAKDRHLPDRRITKRQTGNESKGRHIFTDGGSHSNEGETSEGYGAVARSFPGIFWTSPLALSPLLTHMAWADRTLGHY